MSMCIHQVEQNRFILTGTKDNPKLVPRRIVQRFQSTEKSGTTTLVVANCNTSAGNLQITMYSLLVAFENACRIIMCHSVNLNVKKKNDWSNYDRIVIYILSDKSLFSELISNFLFSWQCSLNWLKKLGNIPCIIFSFRRFIPMKKDAYN